MFNRRIRNLEERLIQLQNKFEEELFFGMKSANPLFGERVRELKHLLNLHELEKELRWFGSHGDGGYLLINDLTLQDVVISGGIGDNDTFEAEIAPLVKNILMFDHTITNYTSPSDNSIFFPFKISTRLNQDEITIEKALASIPSDDFILKLDIEDDEWDVLDSLNSSTLDNFRQILIEFHNFNRRIQFNYDQIMRVLEKLHLTHSPFSIHANNHGRYVQLGNEVFPQTLEIGYARNRTYELTLSKTLKLHPLQLRNAQEYEEFSLW